MSWQSYSAVVYWIEDLKAKLIFMSTNLEMKNNKNLIKVISLHPHHPKISTVLGDTVALDNELEYEFEHLAENNQSFSLEKGVFTYNDAKTLCFQSETEFVELKKFNQRLVNFSARTYLANCGILLTECNFVFENEVDWGFLNSLHTNSFWDILEKLIADSRKEILAHIPQSRIFKWGVIKHLNQEYADAWSYALLTTKQTKTEQPSIKANFEGDGYHENFTISYNSEEELRDLLKNLYGFITYYWNIGLCNQAVYSLNAKLVSTDIPPRELAGYFDDFARFRLKYFMDEYWFTFPNLNDEGNRKCYQALFEQYKAEQEIKQFRTVSESTVEYLENQKEAYQAKQSARFSLIISLVTLLTFGGLVAELVIYLDMTNNIAMPVRVWIWSFAVLVFGIIMIYLERKPH